MPLLLEFSMPGLIECLQELENQVNKTMYFCSKKEKKLTHELQLPAVFTESISVKHMHALRQYKVYHNNWTLNCLNS